MARVASRGPHLASGEDALLSGEPATGLFVVVEGKYCVSTELRGHEQVMHIDSASATLGDVPVFDDGPYPHQRCPNGFRCTLHQQTSNRAILPQNPHFVLVVLKLMAQRVRRHAQLVNDLSFHEVANDSHSGFWTRRRGLAWSKRDAFAPCEPFQPRNRNSHRLSPGCCIASACAASEPGLVVVKARAISILDRTRFEGVCRVFTKNVPAGARH